MARVLQLILCFFGFILTCSVCWSAADGEVARGQLWGPLPTDYWVAILVVAGFLLMLAEIQIISYGIMGLAGSACLIAAIFILVRYEQDFFGIPPMYLVPVIVAMMLIFGLLGFLGARTKAQAVAAGAESFVGQQARVVQDLAPAGKVLFQGTYWDAISVKPVSAGSLVKITASDSLRLTVEPIE